MNFTNTQLKHANTQSISRSRVDTKFHKLVICLSEFYCTHRKKMVDCRLLIVLYYRQRVRRRRWRNRENLSRVFEDLC